MTPDLSRRRRAFSLIELLVILAIIGFLLALYLSAGVKARAAAGRTETMNHLKQIALASFNCHDTYKQFPPAYDKFGQVTGSIHVHLLPYLEQGPLYQQFLNNMADTAKARIPTYISPLDPSSNDVLVGPQNYAANLRVFSTSGMRTAYDKDMRAPEAMEPGKTRLSDITDGTSNTIGYATKWLVCGDGGSRFASAVNTKTAAFFGQNHAAEMAGPRSGKATFQLDPGAKNCLCEPLLAQSFDKAGINVVFVDGSVHYIMAGISPQAWNRLLQPNDGMEIGENFDN